MHRFVTNSRKNQNLQPAGKKSEPRLLRGSWAVLVLLTYLSYFRQRLLHATRSKTRPWNILTRFWRKAWPPWAPFRFQVVQLIKSFVESGLILVYSLGDSLAWFNSFWRSLLPTMQSRLHFLIYKYMLQHKLTTFPACKQIQPASPYLTKTAFRILKILSIAYDLTLLFWSLTFPHTTIFHMAWSKDSLLYVLNECP